MNNNQDFYNYRTLRVYLYYRVVLAFLIYGMFQAKFANNALGNFRPDLFLWASLGYLLIALLSLTILGDKKAYQSSSKVLTLLITDLVSLMVLIYSSGGINSGLGYLLVITSAIASMFLRRQLSLGFAALVSISIIIETLFASSSSDLAKSLFSAGTLGFLIFLTALTFTYLSERIKSSTLEAEEKSRFAQELVQLAQLIVARMRTGIIVINQGDTIELINDSATQLLELDKQDLLVGQPIEYLGQIERAVTDWKQSPIPGKAHVLTLPDGREIRISFAALESDNDSRIILYLEDYRALVQQAQQLKLASLGRLTASIAHEIRNPLGAISHAAQLLAESDRIDPSDLRFTEIILQHANRVNEIVENTMSLSKRKEPKTQVLELTTWIPQFIEEYGTAKEGKIHFVHDQSLCKIRMDPTHFGQVLTNLIDNGLRFSKEKTGKAEVEIQFGNSTHDDTTYVEVIDNGPGVSDDKLQEIFEPFFTTGDQGTGLGLYISRELCEINQATLNFLRKDNKKSCFKINFPHHQRMI